MDINITTNRADEPSLDYQLKKKSFLEEVNKAKQLVDGIELPSDLKDGLSFLDMKNDTFMSYMIDLVNICETKARGEKIEGHQSVERVCESRLILEKSKPIDQKLSYQLNRLLTARDTTERMNVDDFDFDGQDHKHDSEQKTDCSDETEVDQEVNQETEDESDEEIDEDADDEDFEEDDDDDDD